MNTWTENSGPKSIPALLDRNAVNHGDRVAYREKEFGIWQSWTWSQVRHEIGRLALGFLTIGVKEGDFIAILGRNRPYLYWASVAAQKAGAIPVPIYQDSSPEELAYILHNCGARYVIAEDQEQVDKVQEVAETVATVEQIIFLDPRGLRAYDRVRLHAYQELQKAGDAARSDLQAILDERTARLDYASTCVLLYTSGTTGRPKGVVLSNRNIIETARNTSNFDHLTQDEQIVAYLPMAWAGDYVFSMGQAYWCAFCVNCPESSETMAVDLREIGPTYFFAPPRIFEQQLTNVMTRIEDASRLKQRLFHYFMKHAQRVGGRILDGETVSAGDRLKYWLGKLIILDPLKNTLGYSRIRVGYTAGEAIGPDLFSFYRALGINLKQLYGQTEGTVFVTAQPDGQVRADTVGIPAPGVELKIAESGEVFFRSPGAFDHYFRNPESTADTKDPDGWIATGDAGFIEEATGHLRIIDRAKDVGKMANGQLFAPKYVENKLKFFPNLLEAVVFGNGRNRCVAFVNIDLSAVGNWAERNNIAYASYQELAGHPKVLETMRSQIEQVNRDLAEDEMLSGCQIHRFLVLHKELDADDGELTRTRKVRRKVIDEKFADLIAALYSGESEVSTQTEVTYEDGRKGVIRARLRLMDAEVFPVSHNSREVAA